MDYILATDWINNPYNEINSKKEEQKEMESDKKEEMNWLEIIDEDDDANKENWVPEKKEPEEIVIKDEEKEEECVCKKPVPLLDYLCQQHNCSIKELHVLLQNLNTRRVIINHLRQSVRLRTNHLRGRNISVRCNDLSTQSAHTAFAMRGFLGITVRAYYYVKHGIKLHHPQLPCVIQFGGGNHRALYPMECLSVLKN